MFMFYLYRFLCFFVYHRPISDAFGLQCGDYYAILSPFCCLFCCLFLVIGACILLSSLHRGDPHYLSLYIISFEPTY